MEIKGRKKLLREEGYSERAIRYLESDKNVGKLQNPTAIGKFTGECGDRIVTHLQVNNGIIENCSFLYTGCAGAGSSGSAISEIARGMDIREAAEISVEDIRDHLKEGNRGLPEHKLDCAEIAIESLVNAINKL